MSFLFAFFVCFAVGVAEPIFVSVLFRHGARMEIYESDFPFPEANLRRGELTAVGMRQQFALGRQLREIYPKLVAEDFDSQRHRVHSSSYNRTIVSTRCHLMGFYGIENGESFVGNPINPPIQSWKAESDEKNEFRFKMGFPPFQIPEKSENTLFNDKCPIITKLYEKNLRKIDKLGSTFAPTSQLLTLNGISPARVGLKANGMEHVIRGCDVALARIASDRAFPAAPDLLAQCRLVHAVESYMAVAGKKLSPLYITPILRVLREALREIPNGPRMLTLSGHDANLATLLIVIRPDSAVCALNAYRKRYKPAEFNADIPTDCVLDLGFASAAALEVSRNGTEYAVSIQYNGEYIPLESGRRSVSLNAFLAFLDRNIYENYDRLCHEKPFNRLILFFAFLSIVVLFAAIVFRFYVSYFAERKPINTLQSH